MDILLKFKYKSDKIKKTERTDNMDIEFLLLLQNLREASGGILNGFFEPVTKLGETSILMFAIGIIYWAFDKNKGIFLMFSLFTNRIINGFVKITACVYRPWIRDARITPVPAAQADATGYSFPSGHTANAVSCWGGLALNTKKGFKCPKWLSALLVVLVLLIGFSRNYLGVHTPQDVIVALLIGIAVLFAMTKLMSFAENNPKADIWIMLGGTALCVLLIIYAALKSYPVDYAADGSVIVEGSKMAVDSYKNAGMGIGFFTGWFVEKRFVKFSTDKSKTENMIRLIFCIFTYKVLDSLSGNIVDMLTNAGLGSGMAKALMQFVCVFWFVAAGPAIAGLFTGLFAKNKTK